MQAATAFLVAHLLRAYKNDLQWSEMRAQHRRLPGQASGARTCFHMGTYSPWSFLVDASEGSAVPTVTKLSFRLVLERSSGSFSALRLSRDEDDIGCD